MKNEALELEQILHGDSVLDAFTESLSERIEKIQAIADRVIAEDGVSISLGKGEAAQEAWVLLSRCNNVLERLNIISTELKGL